MERKILYAKKGKILTNGSTYGTEIALEVGLDGSDYYGITKEEYDAIMASEAAAITTTK